MPNTEEYFKAHGIIQGQPNELRIGGTLFRFPMVKRIEIMSEGNIIKRQASQAILFMVPSNYLNAPYNDSPLKDTEIRIEIDSRDFTSPEDADIYAQQQAWSIQRDNYELGLREYIPILRPDGSPRGTLRYQSFNEHTPSGSLVTYDCRTRYDDQLKRNVAEPDICSCSFTFKNKLRISYFFNGSTQLSNWRLIHQQVVKSINSWVVE